LSQPVAEQVEARVAPRPRAWLLGFLYAAVFLVGGCYLPYLPVWLHWRDLNADQISILLATAPFTRIVFTPAIVTGRYYADEDVTDWLTLVDRGDYLRFLVASATTITRVHVGLRVRRLEP